MATLSWSGPYGFDLRDIDLSYLPYGYSYTQTSSYFSVSYDENGYFRDDFRGSGIKYNSEGVPKDGTIKSYSAIFDGVKIGSITGLKISVKSLVKAALTESATDDLRLFKNALSGDDKITGGFYDDVIEGFSGKDTIYGRGGADFLFGGKGADKFVYKSLADSTVDPLGQDVIFDFSRSQKDKIDLKSIDANIYAGGNQKFKFIGLDTFHNRAGELRYEKLAEGGLLVSGDVNGDAQADFAIQVYNTSKLTKDYFVL
jgi:Ca2+-binding RTX toxin-like protein